MYDGRVFHVEEHLMRLANSAKAMAFADVPSREFIKVQHQALSNPNTRKSYFSSYPYIFPLRVLIGSEGNSLRRTLYIAH